MPPPGTGGRVSASPRRGTSASFEAAVSTAFGGRSWTCGVLGEKRNVQKLGIRAERRIDRGDDDHFGKASLLDPCHEALDKRRFARLRQNAHLP